MSAVLTKEDIINWRRSTERITLEEYARRLGKVVSAEKETNDLHDMMNKKTEEPEAENIQKEKTEIKPETEIKISFKEKLNKREEVVFNYFFKNKNKKVFAKEIAKILNLPNDYVYKYIRNLRKKLASDILVNADNGGYILTL